MSALPIELLIEGLVAVLLLITIGFCLVLNRKIGLLRADEHMLRTTIAELNKATIRAETAIRGMRAVATEANGALGEQMRDADRLADELARCAAHGEQVLARIAAVTRAAEAARAPAPARAAAPAAPAAAARPAARQGRAA